MKYTLTRNQLHREIFQIDPWLKPYEKDIRLRINKYETTKKILLEKSTDFKTFANGHWYFGFHISDNGWFYREWAPAADALYLIGDFNNWNPTSHPLKKLPNGCFEIFLPGRNTLAHLSLVKVRVVSKGVSMDRIPLYIRRTVQDIETRDFKGQIWMPDNPYKWKDNDFNFNKDTPLFIYEAHIGMAQEKEGMGTFREFTENILPVIKENGYNAIQLMAIMNHPYYASFGYHVSNFFAVASWFGNPEELKELIDTAHSMGIIVLMDIVHSHAVKNLSEGINQFDGSDTQFFHKGDRGNHIAWDSKIFNYGKYEVIHFLLSNIKFWMDEYHFDGFRFDGITSMIYLNHGLGISFDKYDKYYSMNTDIEALVYLKFANELIREINPNAITIAEDMSGMPGMCLPICDGGIGFDYRLNMGVPDYWIKTIKECSDENWSVSNMWYQLTSNRPHEKRVGYSESHDQALVGDKTIFFRLADKEIYWHMLKSDKSVLIERAMALHKMIRLVTLTLSGESYLNFIGNEFGHPEWIDFPREGNDWSYKYCKRQWSLKNNPDLKFEYLYKFDKAMINLAKDYELLITKNLQNLWMDEANNILVYVKNDLIFLYNFNPVNSFPEFSIPTDIDGKYKVVFNSDSIQFGGLNRIETNYIYKTQILSDRNNRIGFKIYSPNRTVIVLKKI